ncbi:MAG: methylamine utilization protein [Pseudomonadota bacterium]
MKNAFRLAVPVFLIAACSQAGATSVSVQVSDSSGKPLADAVIAVEPEARESMPRHITPAIIEQKGLKFVPLVSVIQTGSSVSFPNNDKVRHHIYSFSAPKKFDQKLYSGVAAATQVFDKPGTVVLGCNIHDRMIAYVKVVDTPFFARTDANGVARIALPAAGKYRVAAWHFNMIGPELDQNAQVKAGAPLALTFKMTMKPPVVEEAGSSGY